MQIKLDIKPEDIKEMDKLLAQKLEVAAVKAYEAAVERTPARGETPYSTGQLRQSLRVAKTGELEYTIFCPMAYGIFLEFGTGPRGAATGAVPEMGDADPYGQITYHSGEVLVTRHNHQLLDEPYVRHTQGMEAQPFLRPALLHGYEVLKDLMK